MIATFSSAVIAAPLIRLSVSLRPYTPHGFPWWLGSGQCSFARPGAAPPPSGCERLTLACETPAFDYLGASAATRSTHVLRPVERACGRALGSQPPPSTPTVQ